MSKSIYTLLSAHRLPKHRTSHSSSWTTLVTSHFAENATLHVPRKRQLEHLDSELDDIQQALYQGRKLRNLRSVTCALPAEVLAYIFEYLAWIWPPRRDQQYHRARFYAGWMCVTHICSHWRRVSSIQWARVDLGLLFRHPDRTWYRSIMVAAVSQHGGNPSAVHSEHTLAISSGSAQSGTTL